MTLDRFAALLILGLSVAHAEVVVIVGAKSPSPSLTRDQVSQIFLGTVNTFPGGARALPLDQPEGAERRAEFYSKVARKDSAQMKAHWSKQIFTGRGQPPKVIPDDAEIKKLVADNPNLIGYIEKNAVDASVRIVFPP